MKTIWALVLVLSGSLLAGLGCAPPADQAGSSKAHSNQANSSSVVSTPVAPVAPPAPPSPPSQAVSGGDVAAAPPPAAPSEPAPAEAPPANPLAVSPVAAYEDLDRRINAVLSTVTDGPSANAAAAELAPLTAELKLKLRPYIAAIAAMSNEERLAYVQGNMEEAIRQKSSGGGADHRRLVELAREPGNERFKAALQAMFQTMIDEGTSGMRRSMTQMMERLNRP